MPKKCDICSAKQDYLYPIKNKDAHIGDACNKCIQDKTYEKIVKALTKK